MSYQLEMLARAARPLAIAMTAESACRANNKEWKTPSMMRWDAQDDGPAHQQRLIAGTERGQTLSCQGNDCLPSSSDAGKGDAICEPACHLAA